MTECVRKFCFGCGETTEVVLILAVDYILLKLATYYNGQFISASDNFYFLTALFRK